jgi:hypothetical protein
MHFAGEKSNIIQHSWKELKPSIILPSFYFPVLGVVRGKFTSQRKINNKRKTQGHNTSKKCIRVSARRWIGV